jgi:hypothetical protein
LRSCDKSDAVIKPPRLNTRCHWRNLQRVAGNSEEGGWFAAFTIHPGGGRTGCRDA